MNTRVICAVSFYHAETPLASIKQQLTTITHNSLRLYAFVGTKQLSQNSGKVFFFRAPPLARDSRFALAWFSPPFV